MLKKRTSPTQGFVLPVSDENSDFGFGMRLLTAALFLADSLLSTLQAGVAAAATIAGLQNGSFAYAADTGAVNACVVTLAPAPAALVAGLTLQFKVKVLNTGASTLALNGLTAKAITKSGTTALSGGELVANAIVQVTYDGTQFQLV